ncbi:hypothetical protein NKH77_19115 [Streptomyces sp. M19]
MRNPSSATPSRPPRRLRRRRNAIIASVAAAAVLGAVVLAVNPPSFGGDGGDHKADANAAPPTSTGTADGKRPSGSLPRPGREDRRARGDGSRHPGRRGRRRPRRRRTDQRRRPPLRLREPCSQHFLVDSEPEQVSPPATEQDARGWAAAYGAVSSDEQRVALTVQGTGKDTVVLEALHVRAITKGAPLAWNDYAMGNGCGGASTPSRSTSTSTAEPHRHPKNGQRDFPYKVSETDPEVFYVTAHTKAHDVRWELTLDWSSGNRHGTVRVDNHSSPFRTSANADRPGYYYQPTDGEWHERQPDGTDQSNGTDQTDQETEGASETP